MAREPSFNFGANRKPPKSKSAKGKKSGGKSSNAWTGYVSGGKRK